MQDYHENAPRSTRNYQMFQPDRIRRHVKGLSRITMDAARNLYDNDVWEFILELDRARKGKGNSLTGAETFQVLWNLGYRKETPCTDGATGRDDD